MATTLTKLIQQRITLILIIGGLILIIAANTFHVEFFKVQLDHVMAEVGALFLIVGTLHWMFENSLRKEMLKDIATTALGNARIHDSGLVDCILNSKEISESSLWKASQNLIIGVQYSARFLEHTHSLLKERCATNKLTKIYVVKPDSMAADYLIKSQSGFTDIQGSIKRIESLINACGPNKNNVQIFYHARILRYIFIYTEQSIWVKFYTNSDIQTDVPAIKVTAGTPLFRFFEDDIKLFMEQVDEDERQTAFNNSFNPMTR